MSTFKSKATIIAVAVIVILTVGMYVMVVNPAAKDIAQSANQDVTKAGQVILHNAQLRVLQLRELTKRFATFPNLTKAMATTNPAPADNGADKDKEKAKPAEPQAKDPRRKPVFDAIMEIDTAVKQGEGRKADLIAVVDESGKVIARDLNYEDMYKAPLEYRIVKEALAGKARADLWQFNNRLMRAAAVPLHAGGKIAGALIMAYDCTAKEARQDYDSSHAHAALFLAKTIRASSFFAGSREDGEKVKVVNNGISASVDKAITGGKVTEAYEVAIDGKPHVAVAGPMPAGVTLEAGKADLGQGKSAPVGFAAVVSLYDRMAVVRKLRYVVPGFGMLFLLVVLGMAFTVNRHFTASQDALELGVAEVINGNLEYTFDTLQEFEGLANALNVMLARLLGRPEPGEEDDDQSWRADVMFVEEMSTGGADIQQLAAEGEEQYYARVHSEYVAARQAAGLSVEGITAQSFAQKLRANEAMLKAKHKCSMIRFEVRTAGGKVSLKPIRIA